VGAHPKAQAEFPYWLLADHQGWTVAHEAAWHNRLPKDFPHWQSITHDGVSVAEVYLDRHAHQVHLPLPSCLSFWTARTHTGALIKDLAHERGWINQEELDAIHAHLERLHLEQRKRSLPEVNF
jgi:hypothetical protein